MILAQSFREISNRLNCRTRGYQRVIENPARYLSAESGVKVARKWRKSGVTCKRTTSAAGRKNGTLITVSAARSKKLARRKTGQKFVLLLPNTPSHRDSDAETTIIKGLRTSWINNRALRMAAKRGRGNKYTSDDNGIDNNNRIKKRTTASEKKFYRFWCSQPEMSLFWGEVERSGVSRMSGLWVKSSAREVILCSK